MSGPSLPQYIAGVLLHHQWAPERKVRAWLELHADDDAPAASNLVQTLTSTGLIDAATAKKLLSTNFKRYWLCLECCYALVRDEIRSGRYSVCPSCHNPIRIGDIDHPLAPSAGRSSKDASDGGAMRGLRHSGSGHTGNIATPQAGAGGIFGDALDSLSLAGGDDDDDDDGGGDDDEPQSRVARSRKARVQDDGADYKHAERMLKGDDIDVNTLGFTDDSDPRSPKRAGGLDDLPGIDLKPQAPGSGNPARMNTPVNPARMPTPANMQRPARPTAGGSAGVDGLPGIELTPRKGAGTPSGEARRPTTRKTTVMSKPGSGGGGGGGGAAPAAPATMELPRPVAKGDPAKVQSARAKAGVAKSTADLPPRPGAAARVQTPATMDMPSTPASARQMTPARGVAIDDDDDGPSVPQDSLALIDDEPQSPRRLSSVDAPVGSSSGDRLATLPSGLALSSEEMADITGLAGGDLSRVSAEVAARVPGAAYPAPLPASTWLRVPFTGLFWVYWIVGVLLTGGALMAVDHHLVVGGAFDEEQPSGRNPGLRLNEGAPTTDTFKSERDAIERTKTVFDQAAADYTAAQQQLDEIDDRDRERARIDGELERARTSVIQHKPERRERINRLEAELALLGTLDTDAAKQARQEIQQELRIALEDQARDEVYQKASTTLATLQQRATELNKTRYTDPQERAKLVDSMNDLAAARSSADRDLKEAQRALARAEEEASAPATANADDDGAAGDGEGEQPTTPAGPQPAWPLVIALFGIAALGLFGTGAGATLATINGRERLPNPLEVRGEAISLLAMAVTGTIGVALIAGGFAVHPIAGVLAAIVVVLVWSTWPVVVASWALRRPPGAAGKAMANVFAEAGAEFGKWLGLRAAGMGITLALLGALWAVGSATDVPGLLMALVGVPLLFTGAMVTACMDGNAVMDLLRTPAFSPPSKVPTRTGRMVTGPMASRTPTADMVGHGSQAGAMRAGHATQSGQLRAAGHATQAGALRSPSQSGPLRHPTQTGQLRTRTADGKTRRITAKTPSGDDAAAASASAGARAAGEAGSRKTSRIAKPVEDAAADAADAVVQPSSRESAKAEAPKPATAKVPDKPAPAKPSTAKVPPAAPAGWGEGIEEVDDDGPEAPEATSAPAAEPPRSESAAVEADESASSDDNDDDGDAVDEDATSDRAHIDGDHDDGEEDDAGEEDDDAAIEIDDDVEIEDDDEADDNDK